jgi:hypothetical protein
MSDLAIFAIGTVVFFLGATGLVLFGLDTFRTWSDAATGDDDRPLGTEESVRPAITEPR